MDANSRLRQTERRAMVIGASLAVLIASAVGWFVASKGGWSYLAGSGVFGAVAKIAEVLHQSMNHRSKS